MSNSTLERSRLRDLKTLFHLAVSRARGDSHSERLEAFYAPQAGNYDSFRARLLHGRQELIDAIDFPDAGAWADLGAGTGENAERVGNRLESMQRVYLVDLCRPLLGVAEQRISAGGWNNVETVCADATTFQPDETALDVVTFSYSLTMIPDWFAAIDHARQLLKPGGLIGVVDFYVSHKFPAEGRRRHGCVTRSLWPLWFGCDNVHLSADHLPYLQRRFETVRLEESRGRVPYLPFARVPYYVFVGRKSTGEAG